MRRSGWLLLFALSGCTVHSGQLSALRALWTPAAPPPQYWLASYEGESIAVLPVLAEGGILFAAPEGHTFLFDGWTVRYAAKPDQRHPLTVTPEPGGRRYSQGLRSRIDSCGPWEWEERGSSPGTRWRQICNNGQDYENAIFVDAEGQIEGIDQVMDWDGGRLVLLKPAEDKD